MTNCVCRDESYCDRFGCEAMGDGEDRVALDVERLALDTIESPYFDFHGNEGTIDEVNR